MEILLPTHPHWKYGNHFNLAIDPILFHTNNVLENYRFNCIMVLSYSFGITTIRLETQTLRILIGLSVLQVLPQWAALFGRSSEGVAISFGDFSVDELLFDFATRPPLNSTC